MLLPRKAVGQRCRSTHALNTEYLTPALLSYLQSLGGEVETGVRVKRWDELPPSAKTILLDLTPRQVVAIMGDKLPARYRRRLEKYRHSPGSFKIDRPMSAPFLASELSSHNANLVEGDISGGTVDIRQLLFRPLASRNSYATPLPGVYTCSAPTPAGPGVHGMCGYNAAQAAPAARLSLKSIVSAQNPGPALPFCRIPNTRSLHADNHLCANIALRATGGNQMLDKKAKPAQSGMRERLTTAALDGARKRIQARAGSVALENVGSPTGSKNSQRIVGSAFIVMGLLTAAAFLRVGLAGAAFPAIIGLLFALAGFCIVAFRDRFVVQPETDTWTREKGVVPFVKQQKGSLSEIKGLRLSRETREIQRGESGATSYYDVWAAHVVWQDVQRKPLDLRILDLPTAHVDQAAALEVHREYAHLANLPLLEEKALTTQEKTAAEIAPSAQSAPVGRLELPRRFAGSRIAAVVEPDGAAHMILQPRLNIGSLLVPLFPLLSMGWFLLSVEAQHRAFLANVSPQSRAFFEKSGSPLTFFLPFMIPFGCVLLGVFFFMVLKAYSRRHLVVTPDTLSTYASGGGREWGRTTVPLQELTDARVVQKDPAGSAGVGGNNVSFDVSSASGSSRSVLVYGPHRADLSLGGEELSAQDFEWYFQATRGLLNPATRDAIRSQIPLPPLDRPVSETQTAGKAGWMRTRYLFPAIIALTLLNSYGGGLGVAERWTDANGTLFIRWHNLWRSGGYSRTRDGKETTVEASYTPFSSSTSGTLPESVGTSSDHRWRIALTGAAIAEIKQARQGVGDAIAADKNRRHAKMVADAERFQAALPKSPGAGLLNAAGDKYQAAGKWDMAIQDFTLAARTSHKPADALYAYTSIAYCCYAQEKREEAKAALKSALSIPGLSDKDRKMLVDHLNRVQRTTRSLHREFLRLPGDHFPGEEP